MTASSCATAIPRPIISDLDPHAPSRSYLKLEEAFEEDEEDEEDETGDGFHVEEEADEV